MLMIRLARVGARKKPQYRIVVIEKERARNGRPVEVVGTYNPRTNPTSIEMKRDRVEYWVSKGAQMSDRVNKLFSKAPAAAPAPAPIAAPRPQSAAAPIAAPMPVVVATAAASVPTLVWPLRWTICD